MRHLFGADDPETLLPQLAHPGPWNTLPLIQAPLKDTAAAAGAAVVGGGVLGQAP